MRDPEMAYSTAHLRVVDRRDTFEEIRQYSAFGWQVWRKVTRGSPRVDLCG